MYMIVNGSPYCLCFLYLNSEYRRPVSNVECMNHSYILLPKRFSSITHCITTRSLVYTTLTTGLYGCHITTCTPCPSSHDIIQVHVLYVKVNVNSEIKCVSKTLVDRQGMGHRTRNWTSTSTCSLHCYIKLMQTRAQKQSELTHVNNHWR